MEKQQSFIKKNWSSLVLLVLIIMLIIPQTGKPIQVFFNRLISFSPSEISADKREMLMDYNWDLQGLDGYRVNLRNSEGKVVLVNFWATWCPPCVAEMPSLQSLYETYGDRVDFYFVSSEDPEVLKRFMIKKGYTFPVYIITQNPPEKLATRSLPTTYVIAKDGSIVMNKTGAADWNSKKVKSVLEKLQ